MASSELDTLGRLLMDAVRDRSVSNIRMILSGKMKGNDAERVRSKLKPLDASALSALTGAAPELVDQVLHNLFVAVAESSLVELTVSAGDTEVKASEVSDGLAGELYGSRGWIARFSKV